MIWRMLIVAMWGLSAGIVYGAARYLWPALDDTLQRLFWSAMTLWF